MQLIFLTNWIKRYTK